MVLEDSSTFTPIMTQLLYSFVHNHMGFQLAWHNLPSTFLFGLIELAIVSLPWTRHGETPLEQFLRVQLVGSEALSIDTDL